MFHILIRTVSPATPKRNQTWLAVKFASTTSVKSKGNSFTVSYLIDTCGFSPERAAEVSKHMKFESSEKSDLTLEFFKTHGFSQSQALSIVRAHPQILRADPEKSLKPKMDFLKSKGFSDSDIRSIVVSGPNILVRSLQNELIPGFDFLNLFMPNNKLMKAVKRHPRIILDVEKIVARNIELLRERGVPDSHIAKFIEYYPRTMKHLPKQFEMKVQEVKELGFDPLRMNFGAAIHIKMCFSRSTWAKREAIYIKWGWSEYDIYTAFRSFPFCLGISDKKIEAVMDFLVNKMGYPSTAVVRQPVVLAMSLEKRILPRGSVIQVLMSKGLVDELSLRTIFGCSEVIFLDKFVYSHEKEADELLKLYQSKISLAR